MFLHDALKVAIVLCCLLNLLLLLYLLLLLLELCLVVVVVLDLSLLGPLSCLGSPLHWIYTHTHTHTHTYTVHVRTYVCVYYVYGLRLQIFTMIIHMSLNKCKVLAWPTYMHAIHTLVI